jgi:hypothetical protein
LAEWTAIPVLRPTAISSGKGSGAEDLLDENDAHALRLHAERIANLRNDTNRTMTKAFIEIGAELSAANVLLAGRGREGQFRPWCRHQGLSMSSVYRAIAAHEAFEKCPTVGHFDAKAIYLLSAESCPKAAMAEAVRLAENGGYIDYKRAKEIVAKHVLADTTKSERLPRQPDGERTTGENPATTCGTGVTADDDPAVSTDDSAIGTADAEDQAAKTGLVGLQAVIAALKSLGAYDEYREILDRIRAALEGNAGQEEESEETAEWTL